MSINQPIKVTPEIPASLLTPLELEILDGYGYWYEDDGCGGYQFTNDDSSAAILKVTAKELSNSENESAVKLHKLVKNMGIKPTNNCYLIKLGDISVDLFSAENVKSGKKVIINKDAFVLPNYKGVIYPEAEQSGMVVTQLTRFIDEWDSWREDEQEDEENLFIRFVLSERTDNPEVLLLQLLNSVQAEKYSTLLGRRFTVDVSDDGKIIISV